MHFVAVTKWSLIVAATFVACPGLCGQEPETLADRLKAAGIEPSRAGIEKVLNPLRLTPERAAQIKKLLADLGSDDFETREKATAALMDTPYLPRAWLQQAADKDVEIKLRIEKLLDDPAQVKAEEKVLLALEAVSAVKIKGLAPLVFELLPTWKDYTMVQAATAAIAASATREDGTLLRDALDRKNPQEFRMAGLRGLAAALGKDAHGDLEELLQDADPPIAIAASIALLNQENRKPLTVLLRLLEAEQPEVRQTAANILAEVSGKKIEFISYDEPDKRAKAVTAWRDWIKDEGETAKLNLPVTLLKSFRGRVLIAVYGELKLREVELNTGKTIFESGGFTYPWGVHATQDGRRLAIDYSTSEVVEYDAAGKETSRHNVGGNPLSVQRLENGRTLLALSSAEKVVEIDRGGKIVWEVKLSGLPSSALRLPSGETLVSLQSVGQIVTIDRDGKVLSKIEGLGKPHTIQKLDSGNILVCDFDKGINEYDSRGKLVWTLKGTATNPAQAQRLPNGNTLVSANEGLMEFDPTGKIVHHFKVGRVRFFAY